jgi:hypothetical protein
MTVTTQREECTATVGGRLLMSMELGRRQWKLGFTTGVGQRPRQRTLSTDAWDRLREEIAAAKVRFRLPADAPVVSVIGGKSRSVDRAAWTAHGSLGS